METKTENTEPHNKVSSPNVNAENVVFVIGPPCSGKATFLRTCLPDYFVVDLHEIQQRTKSVWESYLVCKDELIEALKAHGKVALRHTLMKAKRRPMYIEAVQQIRPNAKIDCFYSLPNLETYIFYDENDSNDWNTAHPDTPSTRHPDSLLKEYLNEFEIPSIDEGFNCIRCIQDIFGPNF